MFGRRSAGDLASLEKRAAPPPISILPSGNFIGNDGNWSSFAVRIGDPAQKTDVLISTLSTELWAVADFACSSDGNSDPTCTNSRGGPDGLFAQSNSNTWNYTQTISFAIDAQLIPQSNGQTFGGNYGYDTVGLYPQTTSNAGTTTGAVLQNQIVATITDTNIWNGLLGLSPRMPNFASNNTQTSYLTSLYNQNKIPSLSYSYTAGAYYRGKTNASLTLGGYDSSRFDDPGLYLTMNQDKFHDLVVGLQSIQYTDQNGGKQTLMSDGILAMVDSTISPMWLPQRACDNFAQAFGLTQDSLTQLYVLNETSHDSNIKNNATVNFVIGSNISGGPTTNISFPYAAFDWNFTNPNSQQGPRRYFPLRVADQSSLYTLGRTFLQEAVLTTDYGRGNFTIAQALPVTSTTKANIVPITNSTSATSGPSSAPSSTGGSGGNSGGSGGSGQFVNQGSDGGLSGGAKGGIAVGVIVGVAAIAAALWFFFFRRGKKRGTADVVGQKEASPEAGAMQQSQSPPPQYAPQSADYFGAKTATTTTPHQVNKSPAVTPAISEPGPAHAHGHSGPAEMSAAQGASRNAAVVNNLDWQRWDNGSLHPGSAVTTPGIAGPAAAAAAAGLGSGAAAHELVGSDPHDMPHEMSSPNLTHEMPSPGPHAAELMSPTSQAPPTPSSGRVSPLPMSAVSPTDAPPATSSASAVLAPALAPSPDATAGASGSMHRSQRSSATLPDGMQPTMHDPMPSNAAQNVTAAELASNRTTWISDSDGVSPEPDAQTEGYFSGGDPNISRNTSVASAVAQPIQASKGRIVTHTRSPSTPGIGGIPEEGPNEHPDMTPPEK